MKESISTLMDGELFEDEAEALLGKIKHHSGARQEWQTYHLIGDILRQPDHISRDISSTLRERLRNEPTVLAPPRSRISKKLRYFAMSAAASLMAVALVVWVSIRLGPDSTPQMAEVQQPAEVQQASDSANKGMDDYLMAHQEFSPSANVEGAAAYIHTVSAK
jgi:sigma-E factor negative regulatory protein RseA